MEIGLITFADMEPGELQSNGRTAHRRIKDLMEEIQLADQLGLDVFGLGEHHRPDYSVSSPSTVLAAAAMVTKRIRLSSAVTVLSSDDPVRVFQQFSTIDHLSDGRAEIMAGRGSFLESFPLFGYDLDHYDELYAEKLDLLLHINKNIRVSWKGKHRASIKDLGVFPRPFQPELPIWLAAGGTPASAIRAANLGLPLMLAIIGGTPEQFVPFINLYKETFRKSGKDPASLQLGINNHTYISTDSGKAGDEFFPHYAAMMNRVGRDRGWSPLSRQQFDYSRSSRGALMVGSTSEVTDKILHEFELFGFTRFMGHISIGTLPHHLAMKSIELFGDKIAPVIRKETANLRQTQS